MNALINAILVKKDVALANDGRLLKKLFFGILILAFAFCVDFCMKKLLKFDD